MTSCSDVLIKSHYHRESNDNMFVSQFLLDKFILSLICFARMIFSEQSHTEGEVWDVKRNAFRANLINDRMFIKDLVTWCHYDVTLENSDIIYTW